MEKRIIIAVLALGACVAEPGRCSDLPQECSSSVYLQLRTGDSLRALFGDEWAKVWRCNQTIFIRSGRQVLSPDLVAAGQVIRIPASTRLPPATEERLEELQSRRHQAEQRLNRVAATLAGDASTRAVIEECRRVLGDPRHFVTDLGYLDRQIEYLEGFGRRKQTPQMATRNRSDPASWALSGLLLALLAGATWRLKHLRANSDLEVREFRATDRVTTLCREAGIRLDT